MHTVVASQKLSSQRKSGGPIDQQLASSLDAANSRQLTRALRPSQSNATLNPTAAAVAVTNSCKVIDFDLSKHVAPKFDIHGHQMHSTKQLHGRTIDLSNNDTKIPKGWSRPGTVKAGKTKRDLEE